MIAHSNATVAIFVFAVFYFSLLPHDFLLTTLHYSIRAFSNSPPSPPPVTAVEPKGQGARYGRGLVLRSRSVVGLSLTSVRGSLQAAEHVYGLGNARKSRVQRVSSVRGSRVAYKGSKGSRSRVHGVYSQDVAWEAICQALLSI